MTSGNLGECYFDHYSHYLGQPIDREAFRRTADEPSIQVLAYDGAFPGVGTFCTLGLTNFMAQVGCVAEIIVPVDAAFQQVPSLLANALFLMVGDGIAIGRGVSIRGIRNISNNFTERYEKDAIYFTSCFGLPAGFDSVACGELTGRIYLGIFISEAEDAFFRKHGTEEFEDLLERSSLDPYNIARPSCVAGP
jgi:antitoxin YqcF